VDLKINLIKTDDYFATFQPLDDTLLRHEFRGEILGPVTARPVRPHHADLVAEIPKKEADHPDDQRRPAQDKRDGAGGKNPQARGEQRAGLHGVHQTHQGSEPVLERHRRGEIRKRLAGRPQHRLLFTRISRKRRGVGENKTFVRSTAHS
jgi:hypothetical protein